MSDKPKPSVQIKVQADGDSAEPRFSNMATIEHTDDSFLLDFMFVHMRTRSAKLLSRIALSPQHAKRLLAALQENVARYEKQHGAIATAPPPADLTEIN